jgi:hypothetical protein
VEKFLHAGRKAGFKPDSALNQPWRALKRRWTLLMT